MRRWMPLLAALILVGVTASAPSAAALLAPPDAPLAFNSGSSSERISSLPVTKGSAPYAYRVVFCVDIGDPPPPGSVIFATADMEVTNDLDTYQPLIGTQLMLSDSCTATSGLEISERNGENCTPLQHHCTPTRSGVLVVGTTTRHFVNFVAHAAHTRAEPGDTVAVEDDYGRLAVLVWPGT